MATINIDKNYGFTEIYDKMMTLIKDVNYMVEQGDISKEAAKWLINSFMSTAKLCQDYKNLDEEKENTPSIHHF